MHAESAAQAGEGAHSTIIIGRDPKKLGMLPESALLSKNLRSSRAEDGIDARLALTG